MRRVNCYIIEFSVLACEAFQLMDMSLKDFVQKRLPTSDQCFQVAMDISAGLALLCAKAIIHRDLHQAFGQLSNLNPCLYHDTQNYPNLCKMYEGVTVCVCVCESVTVCVCVCVYINSQLSVTVYLYCCRSF